MSLVHSPPPDTRAADVLRGHLYERGKDPAELGVRARGPLAWTPREPTADEPLEPVEVTRWRTLSRRRVEAIEHRRRLNLPTVGSDCGSVAS